MIVNAAKWGGRFAALVMGTWDMIKAVLVAWLLFNIAFAGWLTWARVIRPDRATLRLERERHAAARL